MRGGGALTPAALLTAAPRLCPSAARSPRSTEARTAPHNPAALPPLGSRPSEPCQEPLRGQGAERGRHEEEPQPPGGYTALRRVGMRPGEIKRSAEPALSTRERLRCPGTAAGRMGFCKQGLGCVRAAQPERWHRGLQLSPMRTALCVENPPVPPPKAHAAEFPVVHPALHPSSGASAQPPSALRAEAAILPPVINLFHVKALSQLLPFQHPPVLRTEVQ